LFAKPPIAVPDDPIVHGISHGSWNYNEDIKKGPEALESSQDLESRSGARVAAAAFHENDPAKKVHGQTT
jgi:hypothetical protein